MSTADPHPSPIHPLVASDPPKLEISHDSITFPKVRPGWWTFFFSFPALRNCNRLIILHRIKQVHVKALIISGQSHVFSFSPETTVGRVKELIWSSWPKGAFTCFQHRKGMGADKYGYREQNGQIRLNLLRLVI